MPTRNVRDEYAEWLATPPTTGVLVETLEINGPAIFNPILICNRQDRPLEATDENGWPRVFFPLSFTFSKPAIRNSSEYESQCRIDALNGDLLQELYKLRSPMLNQPAFATLRVFVDPGMLDRPVWLSPLVFRIENAKVAVDVAELDLVGGRLPTKRAGLYYTLERFEGLRPF